MQSQVGSLNGEFADKLEAQDLFIKYFFWKTCRLKPQCPRTLQESLLLRAVFFQLMLCLKPERSSPRCTDGTVYKVLCKKMNVLRLET